MQLFVLFGAIAFLFYEFMLIHGKIGRAKLFGILKERIPVVTICLTISFIAGVAMEKLFTQNEQSENREVVLVAFIPVYNALGGSGGSVFASRTSTFFSISNKKSLPSFPPKTMVQEAFVITLSIGTVLFGVSLFMVFVLKWYILIILNICMTPVLGLSSMVAYYATKIGVERKVNPDDICIPIVTSTMDLISSWGFITLVSIFITGSLSLWTMLLFLIVIGLAITSIIYFNLPQNKRQTLLL